MKVLLISRTISNAGADKHQLDLALELKKKGVDVYLMTGGDDSTPGAKSLFMKFKEAEIKVREVKFPKNEGKLKQVIKYICCIPECLKVIKQINPNIIHIHKPMVTYIGKIAFFIYRIPFVVTYHRANLPNFFPFVCKGNGAIAISEELKNEIIERYGYSKEKVEKIYNGISKEEFNFNESMKYKILKEIKFLKGEKIILYVGAFNERKGLDILIKALSLVKRNYKVFFLGAGNKEWLIKLIKEYKLCNKAKILEYQNPINYYLIADIFILPSREEGFPLCVLEAMFMKCAIIRSNVEGAMEQITGKNGFLFQKENVIELKEKIEILLENEKILKTFQNNAFNYANDNFKSEDMAKKTLEFYKKILKGEK